MGQYFPERKYQATEPAAIRDMFACGLHSIEILGPCARFLFYANRPRVYDCDNYGERALLDTALVLPISVVPDAIRQTIFDLGRHWARDTTNSLLMPL